MARIYRRALLPPCLSPRFSLRDALQHNPHECCDARTDRNVHPTAFETTPSTILTSAVTVTRLPEPAGVREQIAAELQHRSRHNLGSVRRDSDLRIAGLSQVGCSVAVKEKDVDNDWTPNCNSFCDRHRCSFLGTRFDACPGHVQLPARSDRFENVGSGHEQLFAEVRRTDTGSIHGAMGRRWRAGPLEWFKLCEQWIQLRYDCWTNGPVREQNSKCHCC